MKQWAGIIGAGLLAAAVSIAFVFAVSHGASRMLVDVQKVDVREAEIEMGK